MLKIRLKRKGKRKEPHYRFVVAEAATARDSRTVDEIGYYKPLDNPSTIQIDEDKAKDWLQKGAQPTDTVAQIFVKKGLLGKIKKGSKLSEGKKKKKEAESDS